MPQNARASHPSGLPHPPARRGALPTVKATSAHRRQRDRTSQQLAGALLDRVHGLGIRAAFVAGDEVYDGRELRRSIREHGMGYVMAVRANHTLTPGSGRRVTAAGAADMIPGHAWRRMRTRAGTEGACHYDWAMLEVTSDNTSDGHRDGHSVLVARRHPCTGQLSYHRCWTPRPVSLSRHRWTAICLLAYVYLAVTVAVQRQRDSGSDLDAGLIPITVPELLRLLRGAVIPPPRRDRAHRLCWSAWRRRHQHRARRAHQRWNAYADATP